jgi:uncharacterized repeat protein (TIGR03803 family)
MEKRTHPLGSLLFSLRLNGRNVAIWSVAGLVFLVGTALVSSAQTYTQLHLFNDGLDGALPTSGLTNSGSAALYGTTTSGGTGNNGVVFKLTNKNSSWTFSPLYEFTGGDDGGVPYAGVVVGPNGALYGTTSLGGTGDDGTVFELMPPPTFCRAILCFWTERVIHSFTGTPDGNSPGFGNLVFDHSGNIYGTTAYGGTFDEGVVFELSPSGGGWTETILHNFGSGTDGANPESGVILDSAGNVYGTTAFGGTATDCEMGCGTVFQLVPSGGSWTENILLNLDTESSGSDPQGTLTMDSSGNLYGTAVKGGMDGGNGTVFELSPSGGGYTYSLIVEFTGACNPRPGVTLDSAGDLYGVCYDGGSNLYGLLFELTNSGSGWTLNDLYDFFNFNGDGKYPEGPVLLLGGSIYGTTISGGNNDNGTLWEYTP